MHVEESLKSKICNCIDFANAILKNEKNLNAKQECIKARGKIKIRVFYDIMTDISEHVTLVQSMDSIGVGYWIFESNYKRELVLNR